MRAEERQLIEHLCRRLSLEFARLNDQGRYEELAELFSEDGVFYRPLAPDIALSGRKGILEDFRRKTANVLSRHMCSNVLIDVLDAHNAVGETYFTVYHQEWVGTERPREFSGTIYVGGYKDSFCKIGALWQIKERRGTCDFFYRAPPPEN
jgi:SnoaL-like domain